MPLRIGYVREHFSSPLLQFSEADGGKTFTLVECPSGTGQLISRLTNDEIDIAIALTDPLISGIANGSKAYKLVGSFVATPLNWAIITGTKSQYNSISDLKGTKIGISRKGSGSQTMAYVMALQQGWPTNDLQFQINNDIRGLIDSVNDGSTSAFMWEWFTTKPFVDAGELASWVPFHDRQRFETHPERASAPAVKAFLSGLTTYVTAFNSQESREHKNVPFIEEKFGYPREDIEAWLKTVAYPQDCSVIPRDVIFSTLGVLEEAGVVKSPEGGFVIETFVGTDIANIA